MSSPIINTSSPRSICLSIYHQALTRVNGRQCVAAFLHQYPYQTPVALIALGKAATQMAVGAFDVLGTTISHAFLVTKVGHLDRQLIQNYPITCLEAAHPIPDASSLAAGQALLDFINQLPLRFPILFLISGGTSALVEILAPGITLSDLQHVNQWVLGSGLDIQSINKIRKSLSAIKGGRLATYLTGHPVLNLLIADVPGDDLQVIGSGLLTPHEKQSLPPSLPNWLYRLTTQACPLAQPYHFEHITQELVATPTLARQGASEAAQSLNYPIFNHDEFIAGEASVVGRILAQQLSTSAPSIHIWSSETTVHLPPQPGQGGRCQSLALAAAIELAEQNNIYLLAAGTDGNDGPGPAAGALIDGGTIPRGSQAKLNSVDCLEQADAGRFLTASGDLIYTGPTGTNVMDIIIGWKR
ncbi:hydroxypyruvate reductase [Thioploca ingrica]|uniref:Hydroxypyruvate reductase n=1 Tax=Thioploca ingrica TaxID=40754 RepID=A0A090ALA2_9GAMM|nr:hydroxypyruvate reductase [Thioploca ingrica]